MSLSALEIISPLIIFENKDFIVLNKPSGVLSVPSRMGQDDPRPCLGIDLQKAKGLQIFPVHRLDFEVSGLTLFATNPKAHTQANSWFEHKLVTKVYQALTEGSAQPEYEPFKKTLWKSKLLRGKKRAYESPAGKIALTEALFLGLLKNDMSLKWELYPLTGRPHQLRSELSKRGFPILGDELYGSKKPFEPKAIALRATQLHFPKDAEENFKLPKVLQIKPLF